jgi:nucleotide-binding universal stress UspA family protein
MNGSGHQGCGVVLGYDGSPNSRGAMRFAAGEAVLRSAPLHVVHVRRYPPAVPDPVLAEAAAAFARLATAAKASFDVEIGPPAEVLVTRAADAELLVVGRGASAAPGSFLGSVACAVVPRSKCPVAVVADDGHAYRSTRGDVVVGVDPTASGDAALILAFEEAFARRAGLIAVSACSYEVPEGQGVDGWSKLGTAAPVAAGSRRLHQAVQAVHARFPVVPVTEQLRRGTAAHVLLEAAENACLVVVGSRGHGPLVARVLGSLGQYLLRHAPCPVLVAPTPARTPALLGPGGP